MTNVGLYITLEPASGRPVTVARISDRRLLVSAAESAIFEARRQAEVMSREDEMLGNLQSQEAARLQRALELLIPELKHELVRSDTVRSLM